MRSIRDGSSSANELTFWDQQLAKNAVILTRKRQEAVEILEGTSLPFHKLLGGSYEKMNIRYARTYDFSENIDLENFMKSLEQSRRRDIAQGSTSIGPHRDDLIFEVDNMEASKYASRGQSRTAILALKMAESEFLYTHRSTKPVLLLDDVMSELDQTRREQLVEHLKNHDQVIITTAEPSNIPDSFTNSSNRLEVINGSVKTI
ncbi:MAG: DNA replication and repair protein RecF [Chloroflexi bacterium]|nr:MAG: DNA replication and repair protein RecF [Chloroflexota bacterium]